MAIGGVLLVVGLLVLWGLILRKKGTEDPKSGSEIGASMRKR